MSARERYAFGDCALDVGERQLLRAGVCAPLAPKAFDLLVALVRRAGRLRTKAELLEQVWPEAFVEEGILAVHVSALRKALGDHNRPPRFIETVPGSGHRFVAAVTRAVVAEGGAAPARPARPAEVYELVGRGRLHLLSAKLGDLPQAEAAFGAAIALDPTYAEAHAGLALTSCAQAELHAAPAPEAYAQATRSALRALAMDNRCADAHVAQGSVLFLSEWDWAGAERSLARALEINPDYTEAYLLYGRLLEALGEVDRGLEMKLRALERDPHSPLVHLQIAMAHWHRRRYDETIAWATRALDIDERHLLAREFLAGAYWAMGDFDRHMEENLRHAAHYGVPASALDPLRQAYAESGRQGVVRLMLRGLQAAPHPPDHQLAVLHGEAGDLDAAFRHLDRAIDGRDPCLVHLAVAPQWDSLRGDPRFDASLRRMGLVPQVVRG
jgi:DNA-binding winged helix-turn-helix (wHTH) protein